MILLKFLESFFNNLKELFEETSKLDQIGRKLEMASFYKGF
jgi:hypothetical protein